MPSAYISVIVSHKHRTVGSIFVSGKVAPATTNVPVDLVFRSRYLSSSRLIVYCAHNLAHAETHEWQARTHGIARTYKYTKYTLDAHSTRCNTQIHHTRSTCKCCEHETQPYTKTIRAKRIRRRCISLSLVTPRWCVT